MTGWTSEREAEARRRYLDGESATMIAKALGDVTRNGVIGKLHRLGLSRGTSIKPVKLPRDKTPRPPKVIREPVRRRSSTAENAIANAVVRLAPAPTQPKPKLVESPLLPPRILADLDRHDCRFPLDDPGSGRMERARFCGAPAMDGEVYCASHFDLCITAAGRERRVKRRA